MKKVFEGATIVSVVLLILTAACAFIFNVSNHQKKSSHKRSIEKKKEKINELKIHEKLLIEEYDQSLEAHSEVWEHEQKKLKEEFDHSLQSNNKRWLEEQKKLNQELKREKERRIPYDQSAIYNPQTGMYE